MRQEKLTRQEKIDRINFLLNKRKQMQTLGHRTFIHRLSIKKCSDSQPITTSSRFHINAFDHVKKQYISRHVDPANLLEEDKNFIDRFGVNLRL